MATFDIVSKPNAAEIDNALGQAQKEIVQRFDFKDTGTEIEKTADGILITSSTEDRTKAALTVVQEKLVKRKVSLRFFDFGKVEPGPRGTSKLLAKIKEGIPTEKGREIVKFIKELKTKVQPSIHETQVRVSGKSKDELQACIASVKEADFGIELQFTNFRD